MNSDSDTDINQPEILESSHSQPFLWLPGEYFFVARKPLPEGIVRQDVASFVEMVLEEESPFAIEQLMYGYICEPALTGVFFYALYQDRLTLAEKEQLIEAKCAYPTFLPAILELDSIDDEFIYKHNSHLSLIKVEAGIVTDVEPIFTEIQNDQKYIEYVDTQYLDDGTLIFTSNKENINKIIKLDAQDSLRWEADVREKKLIASDKKEFRLTTLIWKSTLISLACLAFFLGLEVIKYTGYGYVSLKKNTIQERVETVAEIESEEELSDKIEELNTDYYPPFKLLELLNQYRPNKVYFTSVNLGNANDAVVDGIGADVESVNSYAANLNKSGLVERAELGEIISRQGKIVFKMDVVFDMIEDISNKEKDDVSL